MTSVAQLKGRKVGVTRGAIQEVLLMAELARHGLTPMSRPARTCSWSTCPSPT
jgi:NitT/TauT family transport system substrate-binding protein